MLPDTYYHVYNRANGSENLFRCPENYRYFLQQWVKYTSPIADTWAYCLLPNHFHFLIKIKNEEKLNSFAKNKFSSSNKNKSKTATLSKGLKPLERVVSLQFSHFFNSYSQAYNRMYSRRGSLFIPNFKKKEITSDAYMATIIKYIHHNPIHHGFTNELEEWPHSSYKALLSFKKNFLKRKELIEWFGETGTFIKAHVDTIPDVRHLEKQLT